MKKSVMRMKRTWLRIKYCLRGGGFDYEYPQGGGVRDFGAQLTLDICLDVDRAVFGLFA